MWFILIIVDFMFLGANTFVFDPNYRYTEQLGAHCPLSAIVLLCSSVHFRAFDHCSLSSLWLSALGWVLEGA